MIISVANSIPVQRRSSRVVSSLREAAQPAVHVVDRARRTTLRAMAENIGLPDQRWRNGMAPGEIRPPPAGSRHPWTSS